MLMMRPSASGDRVVAMMEFWKKLVLQGCRTPVEAPEPSRSDCHAWSSHPLFHLHASVAGIRPDAPGFARVRIAPQPGPLRHVASTLPHPAGMVSLTLDRLNDGWRAAIALPKGIPGVFVWGGREYPVTDSTVLDLPEA
jgi:hypothetical protein